MSFKVGDIGEVVKNSSADRWFPVITKGQRFVINQKIDCPGCQETSFDIGLSFLTQPYDSISECPCCGHKSPTTKQPFYHSDYFRKIEPSYKVVEVTENIMEEIKDLIQN